MNLTTKPSDVVVADIEGNGLLYQLTQFHCGCIINPFELTEKIYVPHQGTEFTSELGRKKIVVGHNFRGFDLLALSKLFRWEYSGFCFDTIILSRLLNPERKLHSLESYGQQFKFLKGDYKVAFKAHMGKDYVEGMEWWEFNDDMLDYCVQDVRLNAVLFLWFISKLGWYEMFGVTKKDCTDAMQQIKEGNLRRI